MWIYEGYHDDQGETLSSLNWQQDGIKRSSPGATQSNRCPHPRLRDEIGGRQNKREEVEGKGFWLFFFSLRSRVSEVRVLGGRVRGRAPSRPSFPEVGAGTALCWPAPDGHTLGCVVGGEASRLRLSENLGAVTLPSFAVPVFPFLISLFGGLFLLLLHFLSRLLPLAFVPFLSLYSTFHFSSPFLFFSLKKQISLSLLPCFFPWFPLPHPSFYYSLCFLPPCLPSPPGPHPPVSFAHAEITADKRAPPCTTVLHEALRNLVLGSLASPSSLLGGVP